MYMLIYIYIIDLHICVCSQGQPALPISGHAPGPLAAGCGEGSFKSSRPRPWPLCTRSPSCTRTKGPSVVPPGKGYPTAKRVPRFGPSVVPLLPVKPLGPPAIGALFYQLCWLGGLFRVEHRLQQKVGTLILSSPQEDPEAPLRRFVASSEKNTVG